MKISIIVPAKNEELNLDRAFEQLNFVAGRLPSFDFEFLVIDNDSSDGTARIAMAFCNKDARWKYIKFSRNFGSEASIDVGLSFCSGDAAVVVFSDLQDPPDHIPEMVDKWRAGADIVYGVYSGSKHEKLWKRFFVKYYYLFLQKISDPPMVPFAGDFRLYDRKVINVLNTLRERNRYMRGLSQWVGFKTDKILYERRPRIAGQSKAPPFYLFQFAFNVIINFSDKPLKIFTWLGIIVLFSSVVVTVFLIVNYFFGTSIPGFTTTHALLLINLAFSSLGFGVLGEYISKIYIEAKKRPLWVIETAVNLDVKGKEVGF